MNSRSDQFKRHCHLRIKLEDAIELLGPGVAVYYLKKILELETATFNQVYTCYKEVKRPEPKAFKQSFFDTKNKGGWIEFDSDGNLEIPHRGVVFVEHDLPHVKNTNAQK
jgi:hypothetical protein